MRLYFTLIPFVLLSCTISEKEKMYIDEISKLEYLLDSAADRYFAVDTALLFMAYERINMNLSRYNDMDTVASESVKAYAAWQKTFKRFIKEHSLIIDEISYSKKQLESLKTDIKNNKIGLEQLNNYYNEEKEAVGVLIHKLSFNAQNITYQLASFPQLNDSIEMMIKRIESSKK
jgi:hypothetical protein